MTEGGRVAWILRLVKIGAEGEGQFADVIQRHRQVVVGEIAGRRDGWSLAGNDPHYAAITAPVISAQSLKA